MFSKIQIIQIIVASSVIYVWTIRIRNVIKEFELFKINEVVRSLIGATKIVLSTLLIVGIWYPNLVFIPAVLMSLFMIGAQYYHFKIKDPFIKFIPSLTFLVMSLMIAIENIPN